MRKTGNICLRLLWLILPAILFSCRNEVIEYASAKKEAMSIDLKLKPDHTFTLNFEPFPDPAAAPGSNRFVYSGSWSEESAFYKLTFKNYPHKRPDLKTLFDPRYDPGTVKIISDSSVLFLSDAGKIVIYGVTCKKRK